MCIETFRRVSSTPILVVGNLAPEEVRLVRSLGAHYIDEREIDVSGRLPTFRWDQKYREVGWYRQMFFRLSVDRYVDTDQAVILDSEVFAFENWDESRLYDPATGAPRCFYWIPAIRKPEWDYRMYRGAAYLLQGFGFEDVLEYAGSDEYRRHISGVVLFSVANVRELWRRLEADTDLVRNIDQLFNHEADLAFSDHDLYGIACERGLFDNVVPTVMHDNLLGWYDAHDDVRFERFREGAMWSMASTTSISRRWAPIEASWRPRQTRSWRDCRHCRPPAPRGRTRHGAPKMGSSRSFAVFPRSTSRSTATRRSMPHGPPTITGSTY